jgi:hypothetical protein
MKQRVEWDRQVAEETLVSPMLVDRLVRECQISGYKPNIGINSLMTAAGYIVRVCFGEEAQMILGKHTKAAADEIEMLDGFADLDPAMVN